MEYSGVLQKQNVQIPGFNNKGSGISKGDQEQIMQNLHGFWFLALEIPMGVTQFCGISNGEASFCLEFPRAM